MNCRTLTACALLQAAVLATWQTVSRPRPVQTQSSEQPLASTVSARASHPIARRAVAPADSGDFATRANLLALITPFEADSGDPFMREKRAAAFQSHINSLSAEDLPLALEAAQFIHKENPSEASLDLVERIGQRLFELNPNVDPEPATDTSPASQIIALSDIDPAAAATAAIQQLPADQTQKNILIGIVQRWAATDYDAAFAWVEQFPSGDLRARAVAALERFRSLSLSARPSR